jgi:hypothetical protein
MGVAGDDRGVAAAVVGAVGGLVLAGGGAGGLAFLVAGSSDGFGRGLAVVTMAFLGALVGFVGGCHLALRWRGHDRAAPTAWLSLAFVGLAYLLAGAAAGAAEAVGLDAGTVGFPAFALGTAAAPGLARLRVTAGRRGV